MFKKIAYVLLSPRGRIKRSQFWLAWLLVLILGWNMKDARDSSSAVYGVAYIYFTITIYGKRLHDLGNSAWRLLWPYLLHGLLIVGGGYIVQQVVMSSSMNFSNMDSTLQFLSLLNLVPLILWFVFALMVGLPQGQSGDNAFGSDPRDPTDYSGKPGDDAAAPA